MGCDTAYKTRRGINTSFNPRTRMGCDKGIAFPALGLSVSIHAPAWGATRTSTTSKSMRPFQSTHPHGVRHGWNVETVKHILFQSTHPHGVRHNLTVCKTAHPLFQSTHPHGVRQRTPGGFYTLFCFNPRTRMGCDCRGRLERPKGHVSIHAPARGATKLGRRSTVCWRFQSTHPHGVRPRTGFGRRIGKRFNPRTRTGCDFRNRREFKEYFWFQSTHPHGVRPSKTIVFSTTSSVSIHAPARGATAALLSVIIIARVSIHAPARGATWHPWFRPRAI